MSLSLLILPALVSLAILALLWLDDRFKAPAGTLAILLIALDYWRAPWDLKAAGLQWANTALALPVYAGLAVLTAAIAIFGVGRYLSGEEPSGSFHLRLDDAIGTLLGAGAQQVILCGYFLPRFTEALGAPLGVLLGAILFAVFHLPNRFLTPVTFVAGGLVGWVWLLVPNIFAASVAHMAGTALIQSFVDERTTGWFKVGRRYRERLERHRHVRKGTEL